MQIAQYAGQKSLAAIAATGERHGAGLTRALGPFSPICLGIGCIMGAGIFVLLFGPARILFLIAQDRLFAGLFSAVHPRFRTPFASQVLIGVVVAIIGACFPIGLLGEMVGTTLALVRSREGCVPTRVPGP